MVQSNSKLNYPLIHFVVYSIKSESELLVNEMEN